jgi:hypothetical protein
VEFRINVKPTYVPKSIGVGDVVDTLSWTNAENMAIGVVKDAVSG